MPTPTYTLIESITLTSAGSVVIFDNVPQNYEDLILVFMATGASSYRVEMNFNDDFGTNYSFKNMYATSGTTGAGYSTTQSYVYAGVMGSTYKTGNIVNILSYSSTNKHKPMLGYYEAPGYATYTEFSRWANNAAITKIQVKGALNNNFNAGATFYLYGVS